MSENSKIEWTDHTFNPWIGCTKVSPACDHCYAEGWAKRTGNAGLWAGELRRTSAANWRQPVKWNKAADASGKRFKVFCASLADVFDNQAEPEWRADLWSLIAATPHLDWLLLSKRPQNIAKMLPEGWCAGWPNVWLGTTAENQTEANRRIPHLLAVPAAVRFLSCEPLLGPVDIIPWIGGRAYKCGCDRAWHRTENNRLHFFGRYATCLECGQEAEIYPTVDWVICGGESGPHARPMHPDWARALRDQCAAAGVPFFFKQWGEWRPPENDRENELGLRDDGRFCKIEIVGRGKIVIRVGKSRAGRLLDGRTHDDLPLASKDAAE